MGERSKSKRTQQLVDKITSIIDQLLLADRTTFDYTELYKTIWALSKTLVRLHYRGCLDRYYNDAAHDVATVIVLQQRRKPRQLDYWLKYINKVANIYIKNVLKQEKYTEVEYHDPSDYDLLFHTNPLTEQAAVSSSLALNQLEVQEEIMNVAKWICHDLDKSNLVGYQKRLFDKMVLEVARGDFSSLLGIPNKYKSRIRFFALQLERRVRNLLDRTLDIEIEDEESTH